MFNALMNRRKHNKVKKIEKDFNSMIWSKNENFKDVISRLSSIKIKSKIKNADIKSL